MPKPIIITMGDPTGIGPEIIIKALLEGAFECWPKHERMFMPGVRINVEYGEAISAEEVRQMSFG